MSEENTAPEVQQPCNEDGTVNEAYEYEADPADKPAVPAIWMYSWGILHIFLSVWGYLIYSYYPAYIKSNSWWKLQCPGTAWTQATATASTTATLAEATATLVSAGTSARPVVTTVWTETSCLSAAPVSQWTSLAWTMIIGYGIVSLVWLLNLFLGNNGGTFHMLFLWVSRLTAVQALLSIVFILLANTSYGSRSQVLNSWTGYAAATYTAAAGATTQTWTAGTLTTSWTAATSDKKYLMWRSQDGAKVSLLSADQQLGSYLLQNAVDQSHFSSFYLTLIATILDLAVIGLSWIPFTEHYEDLVDWTAGTGEFATDCGADEQDAAEEESAY